MRPRWKGCCSGEVLSGAWRWLFQATAPSVGTVVAHCVTCLEAKGEEALRAGGKGRGEHVERSIKGGCCRDKQALLGPAGHQECGHSHESQPDGGFHRGTEALQSWGQLLEQRAEEGMSKTP